MLDSGIHNLDKVEVVTVLEVYFTCEGVAQTAWDVTLERANGMTFALQRLDLKLRQKAVATKTAVCGYANYVSRVGVMPRRITNQLNKLIH
ncbi:hypothetical protein HPB50_017169 [Hyalomma asiaticum]|uniref:Uncharacterized protein n=1 Tax=Hyalomma asiaticum TaxID=266040 RepID=A0ACB7RRI3_HYAAI|nr:hypothetical protein HPB50_017169 [Hyalomma asiaticum]